MDEQKREESVDDPELKRPEEAVKDLEPEEEEGEGVKGGALNAYIKYNPGG
jgi:hypothetical protein